ncbi:MAG: hypothetical protein HKL83_06085 [Acidimicrobiaceae bacterium]|nr:hypothetical protein [Acidimicrobiaceae bacterium]
MPMPMAGMSSQPYIFAALVLIGFLVVVGGATIVVGRLNRKRDRGKSGEPRR